MPYSRIAGRVACIRLSGRKKAQSGVLMRDRIAIVPVAAKELACQRLAKKPKLAHVIAEATNRRSPIQAISRAGAPEIASTEKRTSPTRTSATEASCERDGVSCTMKKASAIATTGIRPGDTTALCKGGAKATPPTMARLKGAPATALSTQALPQPRRPTGKEPALHATGKRARPEKRKRSTVTSPAVRLSAIDNLETIGWMPQIKTQMSPSARPR